MNLEELQIKVSIELKDLEKQLKNLTKSIDKTLGPKATEKLMRENHKIIQRESLAINKTLNKAFDVDYKSFNNNLNAAMNQAKLTVRSACNDIRRELNNALNVKANIRVSASASMSNQGGASNNSTAIAASSQYTGAMITKAVNEMIKVNNANTKRLEGTIDKSAKEIVSAIKTASKDSIAAKNTQNTKNNTKSSHEAYIKTEIETALKVATDGLQDKVNHAIKNIKVDNLVTSIEVDNKNEKVTVDAEFNVDSDDLQNKVNKAIREIDTPNLTTNIEVNDKNAKQEAKRIIDSIDVPGMKVDLKLNDNNTQNEVNKIVREVVVPELKAEVSLSENLQSEINKAAQGIDVPELSANLNLNGDNLQNEVDKLLNGIDTPELISDVKIRHDNLQNETNKIIRETNVPDLVTEIKVEGDLQSEVDKIIKNTKTPVLKTEIDLEDNLRFKINKLMQEVRIPPLVTSIRIKGNLQKQVSETIQGLKIPSLETSIKLISGLQQEVNKAMGEVKVPMFITYIRLLSDLQEQINKAFKEVKVPMFVTYIRLLSDLQEQINKAFEEVKVPMFVTYIRLAGNLQREVNRFVSKVAVPILRAHIEVDEDEIQNNVNNAVQNVQPQVIPVSIEIDEENLKSRIKQAFKDAQNLREQANVPLLEAPIEEAKVMEPFKEIVAQAIGIIMDFKELDDYFNSDSMDLGKAKEDALKLSEALIDIEEAAKKLDGYDLSGLQLSDGVTDELKPFVDTLERAWILIGKIANYNPKPKAPESLKGLAIETGDVDDLLNPPRPRKPESLNNLPITNEQEVNDLLFPSEVDIPVSIDVSEAKERIKKITKQIKEDMADLVNVESDLTIPGSHNANKVNELIKRTGKLQSGLHMEDAESKLKKIQEQIKQISDEFDTAISEISSLDVRVLEEGLSSLKDWVPTLQEAFNKLNQIDNERLKINLDTTEAQQNIETLKASLDMLIEACETNNLNAVRNLFDNDESISQSERKYPPKPSRPKKPKNNIPDDLALTLDDSFNDEIVAVLENINNSLKAINADVEAIKSLITKNFAPQSGDSSSSQGSTFDQFKKTKSDDEEALLEKRLLEDEKFFEESLKEVLGKKVRSKADYVLDQDPEKIFDMYKKSRDMHITDDPASVNVDDLVELGKYIEELKNQVMSDKLNEMNSRLNKAFEINLRDAIDKAVDHEETEQDLNSYLDRKGFTREDFNELAAVMGQELSKMAKTLKGEPTELPEPTELEKVQKSYSKIENTINNIIDRMKDMNKISDTVEGELLSGVTLESILTDINECSRKLDEIDKDSVDLDMDASDIDKTKENLTELADIVTELRKDFDDNRFILPDSNLDEYKRRIKNIGKYSPDDYLAMSSDDDDGSQFVDPKILQKLEETFNRLKQRAAELKIDIRDIFKPLEEEFDGDSNLPMLRSDALNEQFEAIKASIKEAHKAYSDFMEYVMWASNYNIFQALGKPGAFTSKTFKEVTMLYKAIQSKLGDGQQIGIELMNQKETEEEVQDIIDFFEKIKHLSSDDFKLNFDVEDSKQALLNFKKELIKTKEDFNSSSEEIKIADKILPHLNDVLKRIKQIEDEDAEILLQLQTEQTEKAIEDLFNLLQSKSEVFKKAIEDLFNSAKTYAEIPLDTKFDKAQEEADALREQIARIIEDYERLNAQDLTGEIEGSTSKLFEALKNQIAFMPSAFKEVAALYKAIESITGMEPGFDLKYIQSQIDALDDLAIFLKEIKQYDDAKFEFLLVYDEEITERNLNDLKAMKKAVNELKDSDIDIDMEVADEAIKDIDDIIAKIDKIRNRDVFEGIFETIEGMEFPEFKVPESLKAIIQLKKMLDENPDIKLRIEESNLEKTKQTLEEISDLQDDIRNKLKTPYGVGSGLFSTTPGGPIGGGSGGNGGGRIVSSGNFTTPPKPPKPDFDIEDTGMDFNAHVRAFNMAKLIDKFKDMSGKVKKIMGDVSKTIKDKLKGAITGTLSKIASASKSLWSKITSIFRKGAKDATDATGKLTGGLKNLLSQALGFLSIAGLIGLGKEAIQQSTMLAQSEVKLASLMKQRMGATNETILAIRQLAEEQAKLGVVSETAMKHGAQQLARYVHSAKALKTLMPAIANLTATRGGVFATEDDAEEIATQLGEAIREGTTTPLEQSGIYLSEAEIEKFKALTTEEARAAYLANVIAQNVGNINQALANTPHGAIAQLKNNFQSLLGTLGIFLANVIKPIVQWLNVIVVACNNALKALGKLLGFDMTGGALSVPDVGTGTTPDTGGIDDTKESLDDTADSAEKAEDAVEKFKGSLMGFDELNILSDNTNKKEKDPTNITPGEGGQLIPEVGELVEGESPFDKFADKMKAFIDEVLEPFKNAWALLGDRWKAAWADLVDSFKNFCDSLARFLKSVWENGGKEFVQHMAEIALAVGIAAMEIGGTILDALAKLWDHLDPEKNMHTQRLLDVLNEVAVKLRDFILGLNEHLENLLEYGGQDVLNAMGDCFMDLAAAAVNSFGVIIDAVDGLIDHLDPKFNVDTRNMLQATADMFHAVGTAAWDFSELLKSALANGGQDVINAFGTCVVNLGETVARVITTMMESFSKFFDYIDPAKNEITKNMMKAWEDAFYAIGDAALQFAELFESIMGNGGQEVLNKLGDAFNSLVGLVGTVVKEIADALNGLFEHLNPKTNEFTQGMLKAWQDAFDGISEMCQKIGEVLGSVMDNGGQDLLNSIGDLAMQVLETFGNMVDEVADCVGQLFEHLDPGKNKVAKGAIDAFKYFVDSIRNFVEMLGDALGTFMDNGGQEFINNIGDIAALLLDLGATIAGDIINAISAFFDSWAGHVVISTCATALELISEVLEGLLRILEPLSPIISGVVAAIGGFLVAQKVVGFIEGIVGAFKLLTGSGGILALAKAGFTALWGVLAANPIAATVAAIVGIGTALVALYNTNDSFKEFIDNILKGFEGLVDKIKEYFSKILEDVRNIFGNVIDIITGIFEGDGYKVGEAVRNLITNVLKLIYDLNQSFVEIGWELIKGLVKGIWECIKNLPSLLAGFCEFVVDFFKGLFGIHSPSTVFAELGVNLIEGLIEGITSMFDAIGETISNLVDSILEAFNTITDKLSEIWNNVKDNATEIWTTVKDTIVDKCKETYDKVKEKYENIRDTVSDKLGEVKEKASDAWTKIKDKTSDLVSKMKDDAEDKYSKLKDKLTDTMENWRKNSEDKWNKIKEKTASLVDTLKKDAEEKYNKLKDKLTDTMDNWRKNSEEKWNNIKDKTSDLVSKLKDETEDKYNKFKDKLTDTMEDWRKNSEEKWTKIKEKTTELAEDLKSTIEDKYNKFKEALTTTLENLRKTSEDKWNDIKEKANAAVQNLYTTTEDKFNTLKTNLASKMSDIKSDMETKWNSARDAISQAVETMRTNAENSFNTLKTNIGNKIEEVKTNVVNKWGEIKTETVNKVNEVVKDATTKYGELKTNFSTKMDELKSSLEPKWENLKTAAKTGASKMLDGISSGLSNITKTITKPFNDAKTAVENVIRSIGNTFKNANWSFPKIKLPHIKVSGSFSLNPPKVPSFSVEWYKRGGIIDGITPLGFTGSTLHMGGEAGKEMVVPLENTSFTTKIAKAMGQAVDNAMARRERVYRSYDKTIDKSVVVLKVNENEFNVAGLNSVGKLETSIANMWNNIKANSVESISDIVNSTGDMISALSNNLNSLNFDSLQEYVNNMADNMLNITQRMVVIMDEMNVRTRNKLEMLKYKFENLELTIPTPKIELPHFKISGGFSFNPPSVPEFSIEWYKRGGIINGITPLGMTGSTMHVGGEAGSEMVVPLENTSFTTKIANAMGQAVDNAMARNMNSMYGSSYNTINDNRDIVLQINDREFARASINSINKLQRESGRTLLDI